MATKKKQSNVTRIKATDTAKDEKPVVSKVQKGTKKTKTPAKKVTKAHVIDRATELHGLPKAFSQIGGYFSGAWYELKQVRWPTRRATWGLTVAVMLFTGFFVALIVLLDALFKYLFDLILG